MEYGELGHLRQFLEEDFIEFLCTTYKSAELYLQAIQVNVADVLEKLKARTSTCEHLIPHKQSLFFKGLKFISVSERTRADGIRHGGFPRYYPYKTPLYDRDIFNRRFSIVHKFDEVLLSLESYVDQDPGSSGHSSAFFEEYSRREFADHLQSLITKHREFVCLLNGLAEEAIALHDSLGSLLLQLKDSNHHPLGNWTDYNLVRTGDSGRIAVDVKCLKTAKCVIDDCRSILYRYESNNNRSSGAKSSFKRSKTQGGQNFKVHGSSSRSSIQLKREEIVIGLDDDITKIVDLLTLPLPKSKLSLVTVSGMGGIGKTTLARKVYNHWRVVQDFQFATWISSVSSTDQALSHILNSIPMTSADGVHKASSDSDKGQIVWRSLKKKRYLIVLDDLWNLEVWNAIQKYFPDDHYGSRILITSRSAISSESIPKNPAHCMRLLNELGIVRTVGVWREMLPSRTSGDR